MVRQLRFKGPLHAPGAPAGELHARLKALQKELAEVPQGDMDAKQLHPYCQELIKPSVLRHKDKGVQAAAACILADILRLYAPNAPFSATEIRVRLRSLT